MPLSIRCPNPACGKTSIARDEFEGRSVRCRTCGQAFVVQNTIDRSSSDTQSKTVPQLDPFPQLPTEFGRYRVLKLLGRGGMGAVYLAEDMQLDRRVALKLPALDPASAPLRAERFVREARSAAILQHPNICTVYDAGQVDGRPYITMAFIDGQPLEDSLDPDNPMPEREAARLVMRVALALHEAHRRGIVHRDLKPGNVMITTRGEPVIMDFGLAKRVSDPEADSKEAKLTREGAMLGTPSYMAPEQVRGDVEKIGPHTDVYALGVILFELLTGRTPYQGSLGMIMGQILGAPIPSVTEFRSDADPSLAAVCEQAMAKEPADRFPSMVEFARSLEGYLRGDPSTATQTFPPQPEQVATLAKPRDRRLLFAGALAAVVALLVVISVVFQSLRTKYGEVVIELSDPTAKVDVAIDGERIDLTPGKPLKMEVGEYGLSVKGDGFESEVATFTVKDGPPEVVRVNLRPRVKPTVPSNTIAAITPAEMAANFARGRSLIARWEWSEALPLLAKASDLEWRLAATRELGNLVTAQAKREAGDTWWALAEKQTGTEQLALRMRAAEWYAKGLDGTAGEQRNQLLARAKSFLGEPDLAGVKPLFDRDYRDPINTPVSNPNQGFANGLFFVRSVRKTIFTGPQLTSVPTSFVCTARARMTPESSGEWWLAFERASNQKVEFKALLNKIKIEVHDWSPQKQPVQTHLTPTPTFNLPTEFNTITVVVRDNEADVYANGVYVYHVKSAYWPIGDSQFNLRVWNGGDQPATSEWERVTVWPGENVPFFEERRRQILGLSPAKAPTNIAPLAVDSSQKFGSGPPPPPVPIVDAAGDLQRDAISAETLKYVGGGDPKKVPSELVGVFGSVANRVPNSANWSTFTPDGRFLVVPAKNEILFLDWKTGLVDHTFPVRRVTAGLHRLNISPDGKLISCRHFPMGLTIVDAKTGKELIALPDHMPAYSQPFMPDSNWIFAMKSGTTEAQCLSVKDGFVLRQAPVKGRYSAFRPSPDGKEIVGVAGKVITVFSTSTFKTRATIPFPDDNDYLSVSFDLKGRRLLVTGDSRWAAFEWPSLKPLGEMPFPATFGTFDATGDRVWAAAHGVGDNPAEIRCYDTKTGATIQVVRLTGRNGWAFWAVTPDHKQLAVFAGDEPQRLCRIDMTSGVVTAPESFGHAGMTHIVTVSPDGKTAASGGDDRTVRLWDLATGKERTCLKGHKGSVYRIWYSRDGKLMGSIDLSGEVIVSTAEGVERSRFKLAAQTEHAPTFTPDGTTIVVGMAGGTLGFYDSATGNLVRATSSQVFTGARATLTYSPDGKMLAVVGNDLLVRLVDPLTGVVSRTLAGPSSGDFLAFSGDGKHLFRGHYRIVRRWDVATGDAVDLPIPGLVYGMAVQPGERLLATGGFDGSLHFADPSDPQRMPTALLSCVGPIASRSSFTPDGNHLLTIGSNGLVCVFRLPNTPDEVAEWFDRKADEVGLPRRRIIYPPDELKAGTIKAPDLSNQKKLFEEDFAAASKAFPSEGPKKFPFLEGGKYFIDNATGEVIKNDAKGELRDAGVAIPGEYTAFAAEVVARGIGPNVVWYLLITDGETQYEVRARPHAVAVADGRAGKGAPSLASVTLPVALRNQGPQMMQVVVRGAQLDFYLDGTAVCDPVYLPTPIRKANLAVRFAGPSSSQLEIDRVTIREAPGDPPKK